MKKTEKNNWLGLNQTRGRIEMVVVDTATINELIIEYHILARHTLCIHQDDAMGRYDRKIRGHVTLSNRRCLILDNIYKVHSIARKKMKIKT